jgi:hypothetical protein
MPFPLIGVIEVLGRAITGFFGSKQASVDAIKSSIAVIGQVDASQGQREQAIATIIAAEAGSESVLARSWRPLAMIVFLVMLVSFWFGYCPPNISGPMPPILAEIFSLLKMGLGGYMGARTFEKIVDKVNIAGILKRYVDKNL